MFNLEEILKPKEKTSIENIIYGYLNASEEAKPLIIANMEGMITGFNIAQNIKKTCLNLR